MLIWNTIRRRTPGLATWTRRGITPLGVVLLAGCNEHVAAPVPPPTPSQTAAQFGDASVTVGWNEVARELVMKYSTGAAPAMRVYALLSIAQFHAVVAAERVRPDRFGEDTPHLPDDGAGAGRPPRIHPSPKGAVAGASFVVLTYLYPAETDYLLGRLEVERSAPARPGEQNTDFGAGEELGRQTGTVLVERAKTDGFFAPFTGSVPDCPGCWKPVPTPPAFATLGQAKTFFLVAGNQFRPAPPPEFGSPEFLAALAEVRGISDTRTATQDSIAKFWSLQGGTVTPLGHWNVVAAQLITRYRLNERRAAHVMALMNAAGYDGLVASHEAKYTYWVLRPTQADPQITLPIALPSFPSYPSNHSTISSAAAWILAEFFPSHRAALLAAANEAGRSRIYGGIHYQFDNAAGLALGRQVAEYILGQSTKAHEYLPLQ